jgi:CIC family chloride channel protein
VSAIEDAAALVMRPVRSMLSLLVGDDPPLELQLVGRVVLEAILIGVTVGLAGCLLLLGLDAVEDLVVNHLMGYPRLAAAGERHESVLDGSARLVLVALFPMVGALIAGAVSRWAPEVRGGGGDAMISAFHERGGSIRARVMLLKPIASIATLGFGGAGGREGPTMQMGGAIGSWIGSQLPSTGRERRVLMIAGVAAGISAVFRTPLGAALLAIEVLYRDDFEADALIPAVLASVVAYSLSATLLSAGPMFGALPHFGFQWEHLPFYAVCALGVALAAYTFVRLLHGVERIAARVPLPAWLRPAAGGLALGLLAVGVLVVVPRLGDASPSHFSVLGGAYGAGQLAISGGHGLDLGLAAAATLAAAAALRALATALTIGSGGSAGDFAPSMAIGALVGGAIGHAATAWFDVDGLSAGAFALVGMATFYGGIAKAPLAATVMVCEMAGNYDLLVPLMLAQAIAFVALRRVSLYPSQYASQRESPAHAAAWARSAIARVRAGDIVVRGRTVRTLAPAAVADDVLRAIADAHEQSVFPVLDASGNLIGLVTGAGTREIAAADDVSWAIAADVMSPPASVPEHATLGDVARMLVERDLRAIPVVDEHRVIVGLIDEHDISRAYLGTG